MVTNRMYRCFVRMTCLSPGSELLIYISTITHLRIRSLSFDLYIREFYSQIKFNVTEVRQLDVNLGQFQVHSSEQKS